MNAVQASVLKPSTAPPRSAVSLTRTTPSPLAVSTQSPPLASEYVDLRHWPIARPASRSVPSTRKPSGTHNEGYRTSAGATAAPRPSRGIPHTSRETIRAVQGRFDRRPSLAPHSAGASRSRPCLGARRRTLPVPRTRAATSHALPALCASAVRNAQGGLIAARARKRSPGDRRRWASPGAFVSGTRGVVADGHGLLGDERLAHLRHRRDLDLAPSSSQRKNC
jgi:hypothetical protein